MAALILTLLCCSPGPAEQEADTETVVSAEGTVTLTAAQEKATTIEMVKPVTREVFTPINVTGILDVPPQNLIDISAPYGGFVKATDVLQGMRVKKGDVLVELQHPDYIQLQQDYLVQVSQLALMESEFNRQRELSKENINAQKSFQQAQANLETARATVAGLSAKISLLNLKPEDIQQGIRSSIKLYAPITGYVTEVNINIGKYVTPSDVMIRLVNTEHLHAELQVFEKDITQVKIGQDVKFQLANNGPAQVAKVYLIGREISKERTVRVHCHFEHNGADLMPGMFITASIETDAQQKTVVPASAIVQHAGKNYVFGPTVKNQYKLYPVKVAAQHDNMTIIDVEQSSLPETVVAKGSYTLLSLLFNMEEEE